MTRRFICNNRQRIPCMDTMPLKYYQKKKIVLDSHDAGLPYYLDCRTTGLSRSHEKYHSINDYLRELYPS